MHWMLYSDTQNIDEQRERENELALMAVTFITTSYDIYSDGIICKSFNWNVMWKQQAHRTQFASRIECKMVGKNHETFSMQHSFGGLSFFPLNMCFALFCSVVRFLEVQCGNRSCRKILITWRTPTFDWHVIRIVV